ncbi:hypothetical protein ACHQM5_015842 [Ranunculus cassubicifolius]
MGGLLHLFDFNQTGKSHKSLSTKKHDGMEAPRNSYEFPRESLQSYDAVGENIPHSYQVRRNSSRGNNGHLSEAPMKKLIDAEISKVPEVRRNVPSVVARLMGMDTLPLETRPTIDVTTKKDEITLINILSKEQRQNGSVRRSPLGLKHTKQSEDGLGTQNSERDSDRNESTFKSGKPRPREHPQEELLQKFKIEFEAWQATRGWEHSGVVENGSVPRRFHAREDLNKEKLAFQSDSKPMEKPVKTEGHNLHPVMKTKSQEKNGLRHRHHGFSNEPNQGAKKEPVPLRSRSMTNVVEQIHPIMHDELGKSSAPTRIVILKPGPDSIASRGESCASSSDVVEEEGSIEDLLQEVKERLRLDMQGKSTKRDSVIRGGGIETPFSEKSSNPRQIARHIANQVRESVTRGLEMNLTRSESTRSYRSDCQGNGAGSPEFMNRDTRLLLSQRLRNVLKEEIHPEKERELRPIDVSKGEFYWESVKDEKELQSSSFRHGHQNDMLHMGDMSPRNLVRSLSAPVSGTAFGKLLLEDRHVLTGAQIRRRQEATENVSVEVRRTRKGKIGFKGKVSNLRHKFIVKAKLFGRKTHPMEHSWSNESDSMNDIMSGPTIMTNFGSAQENSTEVPPSPASVCSSSAHEDFYRTVEHPSPISTLDIPMIEDHAMPRAFRDISSNLHELRKQLDQLEFGTREMEKLEEAHEIETVPVEGPAEGYIKQLLIISGLYEGTSFQSFSKWDLFSKPLSKWVFEKVEESYTKGDEENDPKQDPSELTIDRRLLFDLSNEALSIILRPSVNMSTFKTNIHSPPRGKKLLDSLWKTIHIYVYPPCDTSYYSLDGMVSKDLSSTLWSGMIHNDVDIIAKDVEILILGKLIEDTVREIWLR